MRSAPYAQLFLPWHRYTTSRVASALQCLLDDAVGQRALAVKDPLRQEDGVGAACDAIALQLALLPPR